MFFYRPSDYETQKICFSGYTKEHDLKYSGVMSPCGVIICMYGPVPGSFHDARMLKESKLMEMMENSRAWTPTPGTGYHLYGDQAYKSTPQVIGPTRHNPTEREAACNAAMKSLRISVEWGFGKVKSLFAFNGYAEDLKLGMQPVGKYFKVATFLTNCHTCMNGSQTSDSFLAEPPLLSEYLTAL